MREAKPTPGRLRSQAEDRLKQQKVSAPRLSKEDERRLLYELEVHQIELEMQNEELRAARLETEANLERYTELFDFAPIGYATLNPDEVIQEINHMGARLLGKQRARLIGERFGTFLTLPDRSLLSSLIGKALDNESKDTCEVELAGHHDSPRHLRLTATGLAGSERTILLAYEDITERKVWENKVATTETALRDADRRKNEFLAMLSHELRNPLAPVRSSLFVLSHAKPGSEQARKAQNIIERQIEHLTRLVTDLLDVTRIARGKVQLQRERMELGELVRRTMDDYRDSFESNGLLMEGRFEAGPFWVDADPARMVQAISNLLSNAEKFTPRGGKVIVSLEHSGLGVALRVRDTGAGVAPELLSHLFEPFAQAPQPMARTGGGLGLGLAMVKGMIELHGGSVGIASEGLGRGTEVTILLPLEGAPAEKPAASAPKPAARSRRVLVIDDNADTADSMRSVLELGGHSVQVAYDGPQGIELARGFYPEIILCDIGLPGMDGYAVARALRADDTQRGVFLVAVSGYTRPEDLQHATAAGFDWHLAKPPNLEKLEQLISEAPDLPRMLH